MGFPATLVLGAGGRIGTVLRRAWRSAQQPETRRSETRLSETGLPDLRWQARVRPADSGLDGRPDLDWRICAPLEDPAALARAAQGVDVILCLAGVIPGHGGDMADNIRLAEAAVRAAQGSARPARVLLASSAAVYGHQPGLLQEEAALRPANAYGAAKAEMETRAAALGAALGVSVTALRIGNIAGLDAILGGWKPGFQLDRFADGHTPRRSYIGPATLARVLAALLRSPDLPGVLNLAQPGVVEMGDLLRAAGRDFALRPAPDTAIPEVALDVTRLAALLPQDVPLARAEAAQLVAEGAANMTEPDV